MSHEESPELSIAELGLTFNRQNTNIYSFLGRQLIDGVMEDISAYDHVYWSEEDDEGDTQALAYVYKDNPFYEQIVDFAKEHNFSQLLNLRRITEADIFAFRLIHGEVPESGEDELFLPENWEDDNGTPE